MALSCPAREATPIPRRRLPLFVCASAAGTAALAIAASTAAARVGAALVQAFTLAPLPPSMPGFHRLRRSHHRQGRPLTAFESIDNQPDASEGGAQGDVPNDRMAQIQEAMRRGKEKAEREAAGEVQESDPQPWLTPEQDKLLQKLFVPMDGGEEGNEVATWGHAEEQGKRSAAAEVRIQKTLEFCPDGVLAKEILTELHTNSDRPGAAAYDAVLQAFTRRGALDDALEVFRDMRGAGVAATDTTYDALAGAAARGGEYRFVETLYGAKAREREGDIGATSLAVLLEAYANSIPRQAMRAESAFRSAMAIAEEKGHTAEHTAPSSVLTALRRVIGPEALKELCREYNLDAEDVL